jgi:hypothetical protein
VSLIHKEEEQLNPHLPWFNSLWFGLVGAGVSGASQL